MEETLTSVGIDLGTSTTKWILSKLTLTRTSGGFALPRYEITKRAIDYESPIYSTPLLGDDEIDVPAVVRLLGEEYARAGLLPEMVQTGAIILTGETASKSNAEGLAHALALHAGQFVVATAGADLESLLAGKGSGAERRSLETEGLIANVDIGGGTANTAYFRRGRLVATATFHIGGRLVRVDEEGRVQYISPAIRKWAGGTGKKLPGLGDSVRFEELDDLCRTLATTLLLSVCGTSDALVRAEPLIVGASVQNLPQPDEIWISGGVGRLMEAPPPESVQATAKYGDIGPLLAAVLARIGKEWPVPVRVAEQSVRATVIGAGTQTTEVSGATMYYSPGLLPLRNIPVVICELPPEAEVGADDVRTLKEALGGTVAQGVSIYAEAGSDPPFALCLRSSGACSYRRLQRIAEGLAEAYALPMLRDRAMLLICESDMAKALGHLLLIKLKEPQRHRLICLDQLVPQEGDYLDVGEPIKEDVIPVVIKSLLFQE
ncbi:ethanolamine ammonia-lyase reactivating factor EutA [Gorillibacterium timonense]|uniref:ethanolamine ammonia-lyase reactivating factor EutA n=1 Tax=Gorillibacterium timonense TaxID=1689269 RepID=UPI00071D4579|nr:ethanolamine ammonia-lyase reactivating factor EutA [Gorillibacterium timonense]